MNSKTKEAYTEINCILSKMPQYFVDRVPLKLRNRFENLRDKNYDFVYDDTKTLDKQTLKKETLAILSVLKYNYWCKNSEEKEQHIAKIKNNEIQYQNKISEMYNTDNLFQKREKEISVDEQQILSIAQYKESLVTKILNKLKNIFRRH